MRSFDIAWSGSRISGGFCCQVPPNPACKCYPTGLEPSTCTALRSDGHRSIVVIGNYKFDPITAVSCRAKEQPLHPRRSYFAPATARTHQESGLWWRRRVPPPGPDGLLRSLFITIVALRRQVEYRPPAQKLKALASRSGIILCIWLGLDQANSAHRAKTERMG